MKYKVGDKVRVTGDNFDDNIGFHHLSKGHEGVIIKIDKSRIGSIDVAELDNSKRYIIALDDLELITTLTFDHNLALQGSPVYCNGIDINLVYEIKYKRFTNNLGDVWDIDGNQLSCFGSRLKGILTTIPPEVYVDESRWVWVAKNGDTSPLYRSENTAMCMTFPGEGTTLCKVTIKVKQ